jgi:hypothetical protein
MTHTYSYIFDDAVSKQKRGTLPLYGVAFSDILSFDSIRSGQFTGTIRMDNDQYSAAKILDITTPGRVRLWVERDGQIIWGGIVWTRTYQSDGRSMQISAQTFPSYLRTVILQTATSLTVDRIDAPHNILRVPWEYCINTLPEGGGVIPAFYDIGVSLEPYHYNPADGIALAEVHWLQNADKYFSELAGDMLKLDAEFRIRTFYTSTPTVQTTDRGILKYPGNISKYWMTDAATDAAHLILGVGAREMSQQLTYKAFLTPPGFGLNQIREYSATTMAELQTAVQHDLPLSQPPISTPVFELSGPAIDMSFNVGDWRHVVIDDPYRYPTVVAADIRIMGWQLTPESSDGIERLALTIGDNTLFSAVV